MKAGSVHWPSVVDRVADGDGVAFLEMSRLITRLLTGLRAFDFRDDWDDVIQEVVFATVQAARMGKLDDRDAVLGYIRSSVRNKFIDRLRRRRREAPDADPIMDVDRRAEWPPRVHSELMREEVWTFVDALPDKQQRVVLQIYVEGRTYEEAARETGIPLGSLKRFLRQALETLRQELLPEETAS